MSAKAITLDQTFYIEGVSESHKTPLLNNYYSNNVLSSNEKVMASDAILGFTPITDETNAAETYPASLSPGSTFIDGGLTLKSRLDAAKVKATALLNAKTVALTKYLDAYGVIDSIIKEKGNDAYKIYARIYNLDDNEYVDDITFSSSEFTESDQKKIVENAIFYWHVGVEKNIFGREKRVSEFRLRRVASR